MADVQSFCPKYLYRYRSLSLPETRQQELDAVRNSYLWCSVFHRLNDPMEGSYRLNKKDSKSPHASSIRLHLFDVKSALGVCSFSERNDNAMMWAHYADQFHGVCIEYDLKKLLLSLDNTYSFVRMSYDENISAISNKNALDGEAAKRLLSMKSYQWLYEREWRLFSKSAGKVPISPDCITRVFFGCRLSAELKGKWMFIRPSNITCKDMSFDGYTIKFGSVR